jgi:predicted NUDIX family phosphoesterase
MILQKQTVVMLQDEVQDEDELRRISERFSHTSSERAHTLAVHWVGGHILDGNGR